MHADTTIQKWGNSLALRIPKAFAAQLGLTDGVKVGLRLEEGHLVMEPSAPEYRLDDLLRQVTEDNRHNPEFHGLPKGRELL